MNSQVTSAVDSFFSQYKTISFAKGQILIHAQDNPEHVYHLLSGKVKKYDISYRGDEVVINTYKPPAFFPMSYAINKTANKYFFEAETDVKAQLAPIEDAVAFIKANPDVLYDLLSRLYSGLDGLLGRMAHLMASSARSRVLYELLIESRRFGTAKGSGIAVGLSDADIGARAGLARETVNREIHKLKSEGYIEVVGSEIVILDRERFATIIGRDL